MENLSDWPAPEPEESIPVHCQATRRLTDGRIVVELWLGEPGCSEPESLQWRYVGPIKLPLTPWPT